MAITLNFACNDPDNGNFVGSFDRMDLNAGDLFIQFEGSVQTVDFKFPTRGGYGTVQVGDNYFPSLAYREWYGNWCWNAASFTWVEALEIINCLGATGCLMELLYRVSAKEGIMPHHFQKNTVEAPVWCNRCRGITPWCILGGKRAFCIPCYDKSKAESKAKKSEPKPPEQQSLFWVGH